MSDVIQDLVLQNYITEKVVKLLVLRDCTTNKTNFISSALLVSIAIKAAFVVFKTTKIPSTGNSGKKRHKCNHLSSPVNRIMAITDSVILLCVEVSLLGTSFYGVYARTSGLYAG